MADHVQRLAHAREFTDIEDTTLDLWLQLELAKLDDRARSLLDAGLMAEHFTSLLDSDLTKRSTADVTTQTELRAKLADEIRLAQEDLKGKASTAGIFGRPVVTEIS